MYASLVRLLKDREPEDELHSYMSQAWDIITGISERCCITEPRTLTVSKARLAKGTMMVWISRTMTQIWHSWSDGSAHHGSYAQVLIHLNRKRKNISPRVLYLGWTVNIPDSLQFHARKEENLTLQIRQQSLRPWIYFRGSQRVHGQAQIFEISFPTEIWKNPSLNQQEAGAILDCPSDRQSLLGSQDFIFNDLSFQHSLGSCCRHCADRNSYEVYAALLTECWVHLCGILFWVPTFPHPQACRGLVVPLLMNCQLVEKQSKDWL
ncbi:hypothetical protein Y1Q_0012585 [Alligator mississippiensis]|uniref:Uncharacterized protein n=1 Tax=Alligator mississippiensis TaxID=8496 RepID=A0A151M874_ALLMI|nr:hypothetical protein Y1Q_0012585 [Alligator mississippiensis]